MNMCILFNCFVMCATVFVMLLWHCSTIVETFAKITRTEKLFKIVEFFDYKVLNSATASYPEFLYATYPNYFTELISCKICFCFWISLLFTICVNIYIVSIFIGVLFIPINYIFSLLIFLVLEKLYKI